MLCNASWLHSASGYAA